MDLLLVLWEDLNLLVDGSLEKSLSSCLIFGLISAFFGLLAIFADWAWTITTNNNSLLKLEYKNREKIPKLLLAFVFGAGIIGFIGALMDILNLNVQGAISSGVGWPFILPRMITSIEAGTKDQPPQEER